MNIVFNAALKHISAKNIAIYELRKKLESEFSSLEDVDEKVDSAIKRLQELNLLNDEFIASSQAERYQHKGNRFIEQRLKQKGIDEQSIKQALDALPDEHARALEAAQKKLRTLKNDDTQARNNKLLRFLSSRGFGAGICYQVLDELKEELSS